MSIDISTLAIEVKSTGIRETTEQLSRLADQAGKVTDGLTKTQKANQGSANSQKSVTDSIQKYLDKLKKQVDLLGQSAEFSARYNAALRTQQQAQIDVAGALGSEIDQYQRKLIAQKRDIETYQDKVKASKMVAEQEDKAWQQYEKIKQKQIEADKKAAAARIKDAEQGLLLINKEIAAQEKLNLVNLQGQRASQLKSMQAQEKGNILNLSGQRQIELKSIQSATAKKAEEDAYVASLKLRADSVGKNNEQMAILRATQKGYSEETIRLAGIHGASLDKLEKSTKAVRAHNSSMTDAHALARGLTGSLGALWLTYGNVLPVAAGAALGYSFKQIIALGSQVESTLSSIAVKGEETSANVDRIRKAVLDIGKGVYGPREVAKAFETMILAGKDAEESIKGVPDALNLALIGGTSIDKAAYTLVQVGTAMGYTAEGFSTISDVIAKTAAASMSSVESLSEAFKSASSVGKLYGITLVDLATELGALSQLGIQGSAAGTAVKNYYKELSQLSTKSKQVLKDIGLTPGDLKDASGRFIGLTDLVGKLQGGFSKLTESEAVHAKEILSNERGIKLAIEVLDLYNQKVAEGVTGLDKFRNKIEDSAGFAAIGAAREALKAESQMKSVANTIESVFVDTFKNLSPQITLVSAALKNAFTSPEFTGALASSATMLGNLAVAIVQNIPLLVKLAEAFLALKIGLVIAEVFVKMELVLTTLAVKLAAASAGTLTLTAALGPLGVVLGTVAAGLALYYFLKEKGVDTGAADGATLQAREFADQLEKEAKRLEKANELMDKKISKTDALAQSTAQLAIEERRLSLQAAKDSLTKQRDDALAEFPKYLRDDAKRMLEKTGSLPGSPKATEAQQAINKLTGPGGGFAELERAQKASANLTKAAEIQAQKQEDRLKQDRDKYSKIFGTGKLTQQDSGAARTANDLYSARLLQIQGEIEKDRDELKFQQENINYMYNVGTIGRIQQIQMVADAQEKATQIEIEELQKKLKIAAPKDRLAVQQQIDNRLAAQTRESSQVHIRQERETQEYIQQLGEETTRSKIKELEVQGKYIDAHNLKYGKLQDVSRARLQSDANMASESGDIGQWLTLATALKQLDDTRSAELTTASVKQADFTFKRTLKDVENQFTALKKSGATSGGLFDVILPKESLAEFKNNSVPEVLSALQKLKEASEQLGVSDQDKKLYQDALAEFNKFAETQLSPFERALKKTFTDNGDGLERVFTNTFSRMEDVLSNFITTGKLDFRSFAQSIIADLARMEAKALATSIFKGGAAAGGASGGGGLFAALGKIFGGGFDTAGFSGAENAASAFAVNGSDLGFSMIPGMATGGYAAPGSFHQVNENGPELLSMGNKDYLMMGGQGGRVVPNHQTTQGGGGGDMKFTIVNQTSGKIDNVVEQRISDNERALIIQEAVNTTAAQLNDPNSRFSRNLKNSTNVQRKR